MIASNVIKLLGLLALLLGVANATPSSLFGGEWRYYSEKAISEFVVKLTGQELENNYYAWQIEGVGGSVKVFKQGGSEMWLVDGNAGVKRIRIDRAGAMLVDGRGRALASMASPETGPLMICDRALSLKGDVMVGADQGWKYVVVSPSVNDAEVAGRECYFEVYDTETSDRILRVEGMRAPRIVSVDGDLLVFARFPYKVDGPTRTPGKQVGILYSWDGGMLKEKRRYDFKVPGRNVDLSYSAVCQDGKSLLLAHVRYPRTDYYIAKFPSFSPKRVRVVPWKRGGRWLCLESDVIGMFLNKQ